MFKKIRFNEAEKARKASKPETGMEASPAPSVHNILSLQRTIGNQAVMRLLNSQSQKNAIQRKHAPADFDSDDSSADQSDNIDYDDDSDSEDLDDEQLNALDSDDDVSESDVEDADADEIVPEEDEDNEPAELTPQQRRERKIARYEAEIKRLKAIKKVFKGGQRVIMLPLTIIDLLSSIGFKPKDQAKKARKKRKLHGRTGLYALSGGFNIHTDFGGKLHVGPKIGHVRPFSIGNMPWNVLTWVSRILSYRIRALEKKIKKVKREARSAAH